MSTNQGSLFQGGVSATAWNHTEQVEQQMDNSSHNTPSSRTTRTPSLDHYVHEPTIINKIVSSGYGHQEESQRREGNGHFVQHNYHDHSKDDCTVFLETPIICKGGVTVPFPMKLHNMLDHIAQYEPVLSEVVSWQPHGRCFLVKKIKEFAKEVLPRFFDQKKYASFQRQLNLYGFSRITTGPDKGSYYHELFLRSRKILARGIFRKKVKGTGTRMASNPDQEPNFFLMDPMPPHDSSWTPSTSAATPDTNTSSSDLNTVEPEAMAYFDAFVTPPTPGIKDEIHDDGLKLEPMPSLALPEQIQSAPYKIEYNTRRSSTNTNVPSPDKEYCTIRQALCSSTQSSNCMEGAVGAIDDGCFAMNDDHDEGNGNDLSYYDDDLRFVFDGMPFHSLEILDPPTFSRRPSKSKSISIPPEYNPTSTSLKEIDGASQTEIDFFLDDLGLKIDLTDPELADILDRIVDNEVPLFSGQ